MKEKLGAVPGNAITTVLTLSLKALHVNIMECEASKNAKLKSQKQ